jgi:hypothetical protein
VKKNSRFIKVLIAVGVVAATGGASLGITSFVSAQTSSASDVVAVAEAESGSVANASSASGAHSAAMTELLGMTQDELREALHSGKSLATIAEEKNVELSKVTDLLVSDFSAHLDEHVADGDLTREEADAKLAMFKENVDEMVTMTPPARGEGHRDGHRGGKGSRSAFNA